MDELAYLVGKLSSQLSQVSFLIFLVSISLTFYARLIRTKAFLYLHFRFELFLAKEENLIIKKYNSSINNQPLLFLSM
jgi:hypothetical protein